jgi:hypothetical protein
MSCDILIAFGNAAREYISEVREKADPITQEIFASYLKARADLVQYSRFAEGAYLDARGLPFDYLK